MGGYLTSRLYIQDQGDSILFLRPLRNNDDLSTSDRRYILTTTPSEDVETMTSDGDSHNLVKDRMESVRRELDRFRYLATLDHPYRFQEETGEGKDKAIKEHEERIATVRKKLGHGKRPRGFFGF